MLQAERINGPSALLGEGPVWDNRRGMLIGVDFTNKQIHTYDPDSDRTSETELERYVGVLAPRQSGGFVLALQDGFYSFDANSRKVEPIRHMNLSSPDIRFNDGKCDPAGRFWAGTMSLSGKHGAGDLYCLETDRNVNWKLKNVSISNGLAWSSDCKAMYYIDTPKQVVFVFDYDVESVVIANRRVAIEIMATEGWPDGMTIDEEGMLWIAHWGGSQVEPANQSENQFDFLAANNRTAFLYPGGLFRIRTEVSGFPAYHIEDNAYRLTIPLFDLS